MMTEIQCCEPKQFTGRIFFMSMYNDIVREKNFVLRVPKPWQNQRMQLQFLAGRIIF